MKELGTDSLASWVMSHIEDWGDFYDSNFKEKHLEYERIWRGQWASSDKTRDSERSKVVAPHTSQAVESAVAEVEEAIYGRGELFDVEDNYADEDSSDVLLLRKQLKEDMKRRKVRKAISEVVLNGAIYGNGVAEIVLTTITERVPATQNAEGVKEVGITSKDRVVVDVLPIHPSDFRMDPAATSIDDGLGCGIDDWYVPEHQVERLQAQGIYDKDVDIVGTNAQNRERDQGLTRQPENTCRVTKYFGLVPRELLGEYKNKPKDDPLAGFEAEEQPESAEQPAESEYVEAIVVILNGDAVLKAEHNPFMMQDRPIIGFAWDMLPSMWYGRGVPEKGYGIQKALDSELRARNDALALTAHPMMGVDGTKMPRGMNPKVTPGRTVITNGNPKDALMPFNFGQVSQITFAQAESLGQMLQMATGAVDTTGVPGGINENGTAAGTSMSLGAVIKRHKRTLTNFQDDFLIPLVQRTAYRYMQYDPDNYPAQDFKFCVSSSLGTMAREYEVSQLVQLLQTMKPDTPAYDILLESIVQNMNVANREAVVDALRKGREVSPEQQQAQQAAQAAQMAVQKGQADALQGQAAESLARAKKYDAETRAIPVELQNDRIKAISTNLSDGDQDETNFKRRVEVAKLLQNDQKLSIEEKKAAPQQPVEQPAEQPVMPPVNLPTAGPMNA